MPEILSNEISIFQGSKHYQQFLESLSKSEKIECNLNATALSEALYYHLWKIRLSGWQYMVDNNRNKRHPISEILQDLIAFYLKAVLPENYSVELEAAKTIEKRRLQVDIAIKKDTQLHFIIEAKTTIGFQRHELETGFENRREEIAKFFDVKLDNILYIFDSMGNVNKRFTSHYWNEALQKRLEVRPEELPFSFIYPLFNSSDPKYFDKEIDVKNLTDTEILKIAKVNIVTPLEHIVKLITRDAD